MSTSPGLFIIPKRPQNVLPISNNKQWTAGDSGLPGLKVPGFCPGHYPDQLNPVPPTGLLQQKDPIDNPYLLEISTPCLNKK
jgi:hypothetical protein